MKTRQQKLNFPKVMEPIKEINIVLPKSEHKPKPSYECILNGSFDDIGTIPKVVIRIKTKTDMVDINNNINSNAISFAQLLEQVKKEETQETAVPLVDLKVNTILQHLEQLTHCSKEVNCLNIYHNFLSKLEFNSHKCWNDIFAPKCYENIVTSNGKEISKFKSWLNNWKKGGDKILKVKKKYPQSDDSDFDFDPTEHSLPKKVPSFCVVIGPSGVGKTSMIYALAKELNYKVLEMNCSSRRTGKDVTDTLISATANKHVLLKSSSSKEANVMTQFFSVNQKRKSTTIVCEPPSKKPASLNRHNSELSIAEDSLLLFDDFDIVMEEDRGFWGAIYSLIETKSRPVVLTCSDHSEASKFLSKLTKITHFKVNLVPTAAATIVCYLQTILLSRNQNTEYDDIMTWLTSIGTSGCLNLRSAINNLQFDSVMADLDYRALPQFCDWSRFRVSQLSEGRVTVYGGDREKSIKSEQDSEQLSQTKNMCQRSLNKLSSMSDYLSRLDCYVLPSIKTIAKLPERFANIDRLVESEYDYMRLQRTDINDTLMALYNSCQKKTLTELGKESRNCIRDKVPQSHPHITTTQYKMPMSHVRAAVNGRYDRFDRVSALRTISASEIIRKSDQTQRRFTHYFDRLNLCVSPSDRIYLSTPFK